MPPTAGTGAGVAAQPFEEIKGEARNDVLAHAIKGEIVTALMKAPNLRLYRHGESQEIAFAVGDDAPAWDHDTHH